MKRAVLLAAAGLSVLAAGILVELAHVLEPGPLAAPCGCLFSDVGETTVDHMATCPAFKEVTYAGS